jgi:hypothetical protein
MTGRFKRAGAMLGAAAVFAASLSLDGQGMVSPKSEARGSRLARTTLPVPRVWFEDVAAAAGLTFRHIAGNRVNKTYLVEATGSGVAIIDYDNDGLPDILLVNSTKWSYTKGERPATSHLFHNLGNLRFQDVTEKAGITRSGWGQGACVGDYDNDGFDDLFVTYYGRNILYHNERGGGFRDVTVEAGLDTGEMRWSTGCAFLDYDRDGKLDLAIANYVQLDPAHTPKPGANALCMYKGLPVMCGPRGLLGGSNLLFHNQGGGKFADVSQKSGFTEPAGYFGFSVLTGDFDDDGWPDIYIACDSTPSILFRNNHDGTFTDIGVTSGTAFNQDGQEQAGMGAAAADFNHDGLLDIVKTNFSDDVPTLFENKGSGYFADVTYRAGMGVNTRFLGWGVGFSDFDHDGWKDILIVNGHIYPSVDTLRLDSRYRQQKELFWNIHNGAFLDISAKSGPGVTGAHSSRGAAFADLTGDGAIEVVVNNIDESPSLLVNRGEKKNWLVVKLRGVKSNRDGIGAQIKVRSGNLEQVDEVRSGGSYLSSNDLRLHFGIAEAKQVDSIEVRWPSGLRERFPPQAANQQIVFEEGRGTAVR